jgi:hypothetical protein
MSVHKSVLGLAIGFLSFVGSAQAQVLTLPPETIGLTPLEGRVTSVETVNVPTAVWSQLFKLALLSSSPYRLVLISYCPCFLATKCKDAAPQFTSRR